jgi:hypothetical protein
LEMGCIIMHAGQLGTWVWMRCTVNLSWANTPQARSCIVPLRTRGVCLRACSGLVSIVSSCRSACWDCSPRILLSVSGCLVFFGGKGKTAVKPSMDSADSGAHHIIERRS